jgi:hypothetical protein
MYWYIIPALVLILVAYYFNIYAKVKSSVDNRTYTVKNNSLKHQSADLLATVNYRLCRLITSMKKDIIKQDFVDRLDKFNPSNTQENVFNIDTTYTLNKGSSMQFCMGPRDSDLVLYDINTMMYVAVHELAHIASVSVGHTDEFKTNFKILLNKAIDIGVYNYIDYSKQPIDYCGINLTTSILGSK